MSSSILSNERKSYLSGKTGTLHKHHIKNGPYRNKAEKYGVWCYLTAEEHNKLHSTKEGQEVATWLKQEAQKKFEQIWSRELWMKEFKRNYL